MDGAEVVACIQARMSSTRFPGKVLAPFLGEPVIRHVLRAVEQARGIDRTVVLTSTERSDEPLAAYVQWLGVDVFRGSLTDVFGRFRACAREFPARWLLRLCADSPLLSPRVIEGLARHAAREDCDVVTTRFAPKFPKGQNAELVRTSALFGVDDAELTDHDREHVTPWFYRNRDRYRIVDAAAVEIGLPGEDFTVDTPADLQRLEGLVREYNSAPGRASGGLRD
jgi:spore coat polysaccharide biosynthesis protein SpsF (cytidylyltransferase family)